MRIYGDLISGNCLKVKWVCDYLNIPYEWVDMDILAGDTRTAEFLEKNPAGQVPCVELDDGQYLSQSNAIMIYLARDSRLIPSGEYDRARMNEWLFWEQYSHEPYIAVLRFHMKYLGKIASERDPDKVKRGEKALNHMEQALEYSSYLAGNQLSLADIALYAYTHMADEGGFDLTPYPHIQSWLERVARDLGLIAKS
ncbi:MAG: glutathione S-transferase family protein [Sphingomonadales bacterium]